MENKTLLIIGGIAACGIAAAYAYNTQNPSVELVNEAAAPPNTTVSAKGGQSTDNVKKVQVYLNAVMGALPAIATDGISGPQTTNRIKEFQKQVGRGNPVTGVWGTITEGNAMAVYGFTPFQGKQTVLKPAINNTPTQSQLVEQGRLRALVLDKFAFGKTSLRLLKEPSLTSTINQTLTSFTNQAVGQIKDVKFTVINGNQYAFLRLDWANYTKGWVNVNDVNIYNNVSKVLGTQIKL